MRLLWICFGGAVGTGARYLLSSWTVRTFGASFPLGTIAVNLIGSFLLAFVMSAGMESSLLSPNLRLALTIGVMGGFTTYSTFSFETLKYLQSGALWTAAVNVLLTVVGCLVACALGWFGAKWMLGSGGAV